MKTWETSWLILGFWLMSVVAIRDRMNTGEAAAIHALNVKEGFKFFVHLWSWKPSI